MLLKDRWAYFKCIISVILLFLLLYTNFEFIWFPIYVFARESMNYETSIK
jgi:hypothetical protein